VKSKAIPRPISVRITMIAAGQAQRRQSQMRIKEGRFPNRLTILFLVPKLHLGTHLSRQLHCLDMINILLRRAKQSFEDKFRSQVQLGNEEMNTNRHEVQKG